MSHYEQTLAAMENFAETEEYKKLAGELAWEVLCHCDGLVPEAMFADSFKNAVLPEIIALCDAFEQYNRNHQPDGRDEP